MNARIERTSTGTHIGLSPAWLAIILTGIGLLSGTGGGLIARGVERGITQKSIQTLEADSAYQKSVNTNREQRLAIIETEIKDTVEKVNGNGREIEEIKKCTSEIKSDISVIKAIMSRIEANQKRE